jgi:hypothetical protein
MDGVLGAEESVIFSVPDTLFEVVAIVRKLACISLKLSLFTKTLQRRQKAPLITQGHSLYFILACSGYGVRQWQKISDRRVRQNGLGIEELGADGAGDDAVFAWRER